MTACERCAGLGWFIITDPDGHEVARQCPDCVRARLYRGGGGIPERYRGSTWENWWERSELAAVVARLRAWKGDPWALVLVAQSGSNFGSGKTRALCSTVWDWRTRLGRQAYYVEVERLIRAQGAYIGGDDEVSCTVPWCSAYPGLLALDDLGTKAEDRSGWSAGVVEEVIAARYRENLPMLVATNMDERGLRSRYPASWSRFNEAEWLIWEAPDFRGIIRQERA